jgi:RNA polymerase sigma factor (sigma-70 family)
MKSPELRSVVSQLRTLSSLRELALESDAQLLQRFLDSKEELAFAEIVHRHGAMILRVGQRILRNDSDAEDIFQATFLLLARKANSIRKLDSLSSWLFGVAYRLSQRLRLQQSHRQQIEKKVVSKETDNSEDSWDANQELLLDSLADLPERYRKPLISCYLEGKTHEELAKELQSPLGTVRSWIARGRELLTRRGILLSVTGIHTLLTVNAASATSTTIRTTSVEPVVQASIPFMGRMDVSHLVSSQALRLTKGSFMITKLHMGLMAILGTMFVGLGFASNDFVNQKKTEPSKDSKIIAKNDAKIIEVDLSLGFDQLQRNRRCERIRCYSIVERFYE